MQGERGGELATFFGSISSYAVHLTRKASPADLPPTNLHLKLMRELGELRESGMPEEEVMNCEALNAQDWLGLVMYVGDVREGSGERDLFCTMFMEFSLAFPETAVAAVPLIPEFYAGYNLLNKLYARAHFLRNQLIMGAIEQVYAQHLRRDAGGQDGLSLAGKWAPRIGSSVDRSTGLGRRLAHLLFPSDGRKASVNYSHMKYRRTLSHLNKQLGTVEVKMCGWDWGTIEPKSVPSRATLKYMKALTRGGTVERNLCKWKFEDAVAKGGVGVHGGRLSLPLLAKKMASAVDFGDTIQRAMLQGMYKSIVEGMKKLPNQCRNCIPLIDVSPSMNIQINSSICCKDVSVGIGALVSDLAPKPWRGKVLLFTETATMIQQSLRLGICNRMKQLYRAAWGRSTDFDGAMYLILKHCQENKVKEENLPTLIVISDMQFNSADAKRDEEGTPHDRWLNIWREGGYSTCPHVIYWNVLTAGRDLTFEARTTTPGVTFLSGFSQDALKLFLENGAEMQHKEVTPWTALRLLLDGPHFAPVRQVCREVGEGVMARLAALSEEDA